MPTAEHEPEPRDDPGRRWRVPNPRRPIVVVALVLTLAVAACTAAASPSPSPTETAAATGPLVTITLRGGLCAAAPACDKATYLDASGLVHIAAKPPNELGHATAADMAALQSAIAATDFAALRTHTFTGTCPTAADGQELILVFSTAHGDERLAACETALDFSWPVLAALAQALAPMAPLPTQ